MHEGLFHRLDFVRRTVAYKENRGMFFSDNCEDLEMHSPAFAAHPLGGGEGGKIVRSSLHLHLQSSLTTEKGKR